MNGERFSKFSVLLPWKLPHESPKFHSQHHRIELRDRQLCMHSDAVDQGIAPIQKGKHLAFLPIEWLDRLVEL